MVQVVGETGVCCYIVVLRKHNTHVELPSTVVDLKSISGHTAQTSGVKKTKLMRCGQKRPFNYIKPFCYAYIIPSSHEATLNVS